ncbi:recombination protein NinB [Bradyrhizobium icense]|uniref:NinB family protein n=1 Tax=Bradyrhizobium icense TaxID=1274631 RepID=A0A1B1UD08_9BRAD|nr:recombination protein NinB [Bradyrhizobium icense]ANW00662.1 NinB family protein [Bradyrhizobium icense]
MSRAQVTLCGRVDRERAANWVWKMPAGTRVTFKESKRTKDQNDKMWAMLTEVATQLAWHGQKLAPDDWKILFLDALNREMRPVPSLNGEGVVNLGRSSSNLSKHEFCDLIELIHEFGARHGVVFRDQNATEAA